MGGPGTGAGTGAGTAAKDGEDAEEGGAVRRGTGGFVIDSDRFSLSSLFDFGTFILKVGIGGVGMKFNTLRLLKVQPI